jgi:hypothetical protein
MRRSAPWILILCLSTAADWLVRVRTDFDMPRVFAAEALIFPISALALGILRWKSPAAGRKTRALQTTMVWTFALAGLRSAMIALGSSYQLAIIVPSTVAVIGLWLGWRRRRRSSTDAMSKGTETRGE